jgi:two-component system chemotaxis response regulator CheY
MPTKSLSEAKIFVIDSSSFFIASLKKKLISHGATVENEPTAEKALMRILRFRPDLIITGIEVGTISGYDLCVILRLMPDYATIPIAIVSNDDAKEKKSVADHALEAGADYIIHKNADWMATIQSILAKTFLNETQSTRHSSKGTIETILVVDDSKVMRTVIKNILCGLGISVIEASNGKEAIKRLAEKRADLILTDWNMPEMTGIELIEHLKKEVPYKNIPIVMVTTEGGKKEITEAQVAGADYHISKPFTAEMLQTMIRHFSKG